MDLKRTVIFVQESDKEKRLEVETNVSKVLATYPDFILAQAKEEQIQSFKEQGIKVEEKKSQSIRLQAVEFEPSEEVPSPSSSLKLSTEEIETKENYWIVQFVGPAKPKWSEKIKELGADFHSYIPKNAFLVLMTSQIKEKVEELPFVNWVGVYEPAYKINRLLMGKKEKASPAELSNLSVNTETYKPKPEGNINIILHNPADLKKVSGEVEKLGGNVVSAENDRIRASIDLSNVEVLAKMVEIKWIEPYILPKLFNDVAAGITGVQPVWNNHGLDGEGQIIGIADTGLDTGVNNATMHDDFEGRIVNIHSWAIPAGLHQYLDNTNWDDGPGDVDGHGTHVAGSVLGNGTKSGGTIKGMAFNSRVVFQAVEQWADINAQYASPDFNDGYYLFGIPDNLNDLFQQAYDEGARIHTNSWGDQNFGQYTENSNDIDEFCWSHRDMVILFAAGNAGSDGNRNGVVDNDSLGSQACAKNCISVGASENNRSVGGLQRTYNQAWPDNFPVNPIKNDLVSNDPNGMVAFSSRGPADDGRIKPDVVAPGTNILSVKSSLATGTGWGLLPTGDPNRPFYVYLGGTSMSTPIVAGTVALIRQYLQKACLHNPSSALVKAFLIHGAQQLTGQYNPSEAGAIPNNNQGWGRINLQNSLFPNYPVKTEFKDSSTDALGTGENRSYTFQVANNTAPFKATLVWTDFPNTPPAGGLYNILRLSVIQPDGTTIQGTPNNNNVQQVDVNNPQVGTYTVQVSGINVPTVAIRGERQDFSVVVSGGLDFVDLYIKDNPSDNGVSPSAGNLYLSPDIWVNLNNDPSAAPALNPEYGQTNFVFVKVRNRGPKAANNAQVKLYWANPGTNLSRPFWQTSDIKVNGVAGNIQSINVPGRSAAGEGEAIAVFEWRPPSPATNTYDPGHFCLFATVTHPEDPLLMEDVESVRWEDNLAWKNLIVKDVLPDTTTEMEFHVAGNKEKPSMSSFLIDKSALPKGSVKLRIPNKFLKASEKTNLRIIEGSKEKLFTWVELTGKTANLTGIKLKPKENILIRLEVTLPKNIIDRKKYPIFIEQKSNNEITGRVTLIARTIKKPAYIANRQAGEIHLANCERLAKVQKKFNVPFNDLKLAYQRGYKDCKHCLNRI